MQQNNFFALEQVIDREPLTVSSMTPLNEVIRLMQAWGNHCSIVDNSTNLGNSSCVLVVDNSQLQGIFTERDLVKLIAQGIETSEATVGEFMTQDVVTITFANSPDIFNVLSILRSHKIRHLPIVDQQQNLQGLITAKNLRQKLQPINMMKWRKVKEIMEKKVIYAAPDDSVRYLAKLMTTYQSSYVAIAKSELDSQGEQSLIRPLGIVTERDIVQFQNLNLDLEQPAQNLMSQPLFLIHPEDTIWSVKQKMQHHRIRRLLVTGEQGELSGIITQTSLLQVFEPAEMHEVIKSLQQQVGQLETDKELLLVNRQAILEQEIQERTAALKLTQQQLQIKVKQQQTIAQLGQYALKEKQLAPILEKIVRLVAKTLEVEYCKVLELLPDGENLLLKAGVGWQEGIVGVTTISTDNSSQAGYTLNSSEPVIVENLLAETRFKGPDLLLDNQVISGMSIKIGDNARPFGILGIHTTKQRNFSQDDVNFIQAIANVIAQTNERQQVEAALRDSEQKFRAIFDQTFQFIGLLEPNGNLIEANQTALEFVGLTPDDVRGKPFWETPWWSISPEIQELIKNGIQQAAQGNFIRFEVEHPGTDNRLVTVDFSLTPIKDETGKVIMLIPEGRDISELKQTERSLQESQERYALAVKGSNSGLWDWNVITNEMFFAPRWHEILDCTKAELSNNFDAWSSRLHPLDRDLVLAAISDHLQNHIPYNIEYRLLKQNGEYCWIQSRGQAIWNKQGKAIRMAGSISDISDRKQREEILKDIASGMSVDLGEKFLPSLVEYLSKTLQIDYAFVGQLSNPEHKYVKTLAVYGHDRIIDNFEYEVRISPCHQIIEQGFCIYPQGVQALFPEDHLLQAMQIESYAGMPISDASGQAFGLIAILDTKPFDLKVIPLIEEVLKIFAVRAISEIERQQAESKIHQQASLLNVATDAIIVRSLDDKILFWSQGAAKIYGWTEAEAMGENARWLLSGKPAQKLDQIQQAVREQGKWQGELNHVTKAGNHLVVESRWTLVNDKLDNPQSYLVVNTDITERKALEAQFLRTQRLESLGTLAGGIAHDLNNILAPILGFAKLLPLKLPNVDEQTKKYFKIIENNANRGSALVKQILTFSRGLEGDRGIVQIRHLIAEIGQIIHETFPKTIELEINVPKHLWAINADVNQLHQVLMNLAVNARDAMPDGGKLTIKAENYLVDADYARLHLDAQEGSYILITVTDTGVGISPEIIDRIFEPFFTTKAIGRGTGLGLSTAIGIIRSHNGFIDVISEQKKETQGTEFQIFLPAAETTATAIEDQETIPQGQGEVILVVDDEVAILEVMMAVLETYNYQVITATNGMEAIAAYAQNQAQIDLVIMDMMMPVMDGKTAILTLKEINPAIKIIAVSGLVDRQAIVSKIDQDITAFMAKPFNNSDLLQIVHDSLNRAK